MAEKVDPKGYTLGFFPLRRLPHRHAVAATLGDAMPNPNWLDALIGDINKLRTPLTMLKGEHTFIFNWHENAIRSLGDAMISQAENPDTIFDFDDAERMAEQAEHLLHEGL